MQRTYGVSRPDQLYSIPGKREPDLPELAVDMAGKKVLVQTQDMATDAAFETPF